MTTMITRRVNGAMIESPSFCDYPLATYAADLSALGQPEVFQSMFSYKSIGTSVRLARDSHRSQWTPNSGATRGFQNVTARLYLSRMQLGCSSEITVKQESGRSKTLLAIVRIWRWHTTVTFQWLILPRRAWHARSRRA